VGYEHRIEPERRLVRVTLRGPVDFYSTLREVVEIANDPRLGEGYRLLSDIREMEGNLSVDEVWTVARLMAAQGAKFRGPLATVVDGAFYYGLVCLFATIGRLFGLRARPFHSVEKALAWLDAVDPSPVRGPLALLPDRL
jgi:hypothetical protein